MSDLDLLVEEELTAIRLFGFNTYKYENQERAAQLRGRLDAFRREAVERGLRRQETGLLTEKGAALQHEEDPRVARLSEQNRRFIQQSL